jgi:hypothetical protein
LKLASVLMLAACGVQSSGGNDSAVAPPADVTLQIGAERSIGGVLIRFVKVNEDSRCPSDVQCVWAGNAAVELRLTSGKAAPMVRVLNSGIDPKTIEEFGLRITLKELSPAPRAGGGAGDSAPPAVTLHVEKP